MVGPCLGLFAIVITEYPYQEIYKDQEIYKEDISLAHSSGEWEAQRRGHSLAALQRAEDITG